MTQAKDNINTQTYNLFEHVENFKKTANLYGEIKTAQKFYNGDHFIGDENRDNILRMSANIVSYGIDTIASKLNGTPVYLTFTSDTEVISTKLSEFDRYVLERINHKTYRYEKGKTSLINGTHIAHVVWDEEFTAYKGIYKGGIREDHVDVGNFAVHNPYKDSLQDQKWIIHRMYCEIGFIKSLIDCKNESDKKRIEELIIEENFDEREINDTKNNQFLNSKYAYVYFRYFRINGEVYYTASTRTVSLFEFPHALNPNINKESPMIKEFYKKYEKKIDSNEKSDEYYADFDMDFENYLLNVSNPTTYSDEEYQKDKRKFSLYPFAKFSAKPIAGSFFGKSWIIGMVPAQKAINFFLTAIGKSLELTAMPKMLVKPGALREVLTGRPGEKITDYFQGNGSGISYMSPPPVSNQTFEMINILTGLTSKFGGFSDVMTGQISNQDISGYALQLAMKQNNTVLEQMQQLLWASEIELAQIRLLYYKFYMQRSDYLYEVSREEMNAQDNSKQALKRRVKQGKSTILGVEDIDKLDEPTTQFKRETITQEEIMEYEFDISVEATQGVLDSELSEGQRWDALFMNGGLQNIQPQILKLWAVLNPTIPLRTKKQMNKMFDELAQNKLTLTEEQLKQALALLEESKNEMIKLQEKVRFADEYDKNITKEFSNKLNTANKVIDLQNQALQKGVSEGEAKSSNARGIKGSDIAPPQQDLDTSL